VSEGSTILVVGVPRSGTSWVGRVLASTPDAGYLGEPDNHEHSPFALRAKLGLQGHYYSDLDPSVDAPAYERLWREAFTAPSPGGDSALERARRAASLRLLRRASDAEVRRSIADPGRATRSVRLAARLAVPDRPSAASRNLVVKTVHAQLALDWIAERFPVKVLVVLRRPLNVVSSWKQMGWLHAGADVLGELDPRSLSRLERASGVAAVSGGPPLEQATQLIGLLTGALLDATRRHPEWSVVAHEALCAEPHRCFRIAASELGLGWSGAVDRMLDELNRPGTRYETLRVAADLDDVWRTRLTQEEIDAASTQLRRFDLDWSHPATSTQGAVSAE
jgi:hypothetical protein